MSTHRIPPHPQQSINGITAKRLGFALAKRFEYLMALKLMLVLCILFLAHAALATMKEQPIEVVVFNGKLTTQNGSQPSAEALAVSGQRIVAVGTSEDILKLADEATLRIDAKQRRIIPGLNDSHSHVVRGGRFYNAELRWDGIPTLKIALERVAKQAAITPDGQWVRVIGGWSPFQFAEKRMPTPEELNEAAPDKPVFILFLYSQGLLNKAGLEALGITAENAERKAPEGTRYEVVDGKLTGRLLAEPNPTILYQTIGALPSLSPEEKLNSTKQFYRELNRFGLTSAVDAGGGGHVFPQDYEGTRLLAEDGAMPLRVSYYLFPQTPGGEASEFTSWQLHNEVGDNHAKRLFHGYELEGGGEFLTWSAGDFENFLAPRPELDERGDWQAELETVTRTLLRSGWPLRVHTTYNESITSVLDVFERIDKAEKSVGRKGFHSIRWALDHCETISKENIERVRALGGGINVQSRMAFAGEYFAERYGIERAQQSPPLRMILDSGVPIGAGTDATRVGSYNPWVALRWMSEGLSAGGTVILDRENRLTRAEALRVYTIGSAWFSGEENHKGRLMTGQYADFAILSDDFFEVSSEQISTIESVLTVTGGRVVFAQDEFESLDPGIEAAIPAWSPINRFGGYYKGGAQ